VYHESVEHFESKDRLGKVCALIADCIIYHIVTTHYDIAWL